MIDILGDILLNSWLYEVEDRCQAFMCPYGFFMGLHNVRQWEWQSELQTQVLKNHKKTFLVQISPL